MQVRDRLKKMGHLQPLNIFLRQEIDRMQKVVTAVRNTLSDLKLAIDGTIIMSETLRDALDSMYDARIPATWKRVRKGLKCVCVGNPFQSRGALPAIWDYTVLCFARHR